jgi:putative phosphoribosyl transferase
MTAIKVPLDSDSLFLEGDLHISKAPTGIILFAHGSGSSRHSPKNKYVSEVLQRDRLATLLAKEEESDTRHRKLAITSLDLY